MAIPDIVHVEWASTDLERTGAFLSSLFDWHFETLGNKHLVLKPADRLVVWIHKSDVVTPADFPVVFFEVEKIEPFLKKAKELGGEINMEQMEIKGYGWFAQVRDRDGNIFGLFQSTG